MSLCPDFDMLDLLADGLPLSSAQFSGARTRKEAFDLLAAFVRRCGDWDLVLTVIPPGDMANQAVQWSTLAGERMDDLRALGFDGRDPIRRFARRSIEPFVWTSREWPGERSASAREIMAGVGKVGIEGGVSLAVWGRGGRVAIVDALSTGADMAAVPPSFPDYLFVSTMLAARTIERLSLVRGTMPLTRREIEILELAAQGLTNGAVAEQLEIVEETVKFHFRSIREKLKAQSRTDAIARFAVLDATWDQSFRPGPERVCA